MRFDLNILWDTILVVLQAVPRVLLLALVVLILGIGLGSLIALVRRRQIPIVNQLLEIFISYMRGVPLIVHLFIIRYSLPNVAASFMNLLGFGMEPSEFPNILLIIVAFTLLEAAIESENIRGALNAVSKDQVEAALSIGMTKKQSLQRIIFPQALTVAIPLFLNAYLKAIKIQSLAFTVGVVDILTQARFAAALSYHYLESYLAAALVYWLICGLLQVVFDHLSQKISFEKGV
ncbi:amino acid ABC transporter permease [Aerococcus urinae]